MKDPRVNFVDNIASGIDRLGLAKAPVVYALARVPWDSAEDRDAFFDTVSKVDAP